MARMGKKRKHNKTTSEGNEQQSRHDDNTTTTISIKSNEKRKKRRRTSTNESSSLSAAGVKDPSSTEALEDDDDDEKERERMATMHGLYHVDVSTRKCFFQKLVIPMRKMPNNNNKEQQKCWEIHLGDSVSVQDDIIHVKKMASQRRNHPFFWNVSWFASEIICFWVRVDTATQARKLQQMMLTAADSAAATGSAKKGMKISLPIFKVKMEIRRFYFLGDIPGVSVTKKIKHHRSSTQEDEEDDDEVNVLEEVFETDHVSDDFPAHMLLSPVLLHTEETHKPNTNGKTDGELDTTLHLHSARFWSVHRKSCIPMGPVEHRIHRGRAHSRYLGTANPIIRAALQTVIGNTEEDGKGVPMPFSAQQHSKNDHEFYSRTFQETISRLSLTDTSADVGERGVALIGREQEMQRIKLFLRRAILANDPTHAVENKLAVDQSSMFIGGPPGVGKTASVRSVISQLQREQAAGDIPPFDFIPLNGMELKHPFDSYVKLWEAVSPEKDRQSAGVAAALLEQYFCEQDNNECGYDSRPARQANRVSRTVVVLLDEIDYLVTKKQTVLYNFFDWPRRATLGGGSSAHQRRLIVIGISNTINLPERLKPSVQSRLGGERCIFQSYNSKKTTAILQSRVEFPARILNGKKIQSIFDVDAIAFAARKTAVFSGDIRKAFQLCKLAAERVWADFSIKTQDNRHDTPEFPFVRIGDIQKASRATSNSIMNKAVSLSTPFEALVIISLALLKKQKQTMGQLSMMEGLDIHDIVVKVRSVASSSGDHQYLPPPSFGEITYILNTLVEAGIVTIQHSSSYGPWPRTLLSMESYEVDTAFRNTPHMQLITKLATHSNNSLL